MSHSNKLQKFLTYFLGNGIEITTLNMNIETHKHYRLVLKY